jgi:hypothetical protein
MFQIMASTHVLLHRHLLRVQPLVLPSCRHKYTAPTVKQAVHKKYNVRDINHPQVNKVDLAKVGFVGDSAASVSVFVSV